MFELTFSKNPTVLTGATSPTFSYVATDGDRFSGVISLSGTGQSINLLTSTGASSAATTMPAALLGSSGGSPSAGWSFAAIVKFTTLTANAPIFDFKDASSNRIRMYITATGNVEFSLNSLLVTSPSAVSTGSYYHLAVVVNSAGIATLYINKDAVGTASGAALAAVTFTTAYLGQSTDSTAVYLNGRIDAFRIYDVALTAVEIGKLHQTTISAPDGFLEQPRLAPVPQTAPVSSYTFSKGVPTLGTAGMTRYTQLPSLLDRSGMAMFDGVNDIIQLKDYPDDEGKLIPTMFGGSMTFETTFQFLSSSKQANVFGFTGRTGGQDVNLMLTNTWLEEPTNINSMKAEVAGARGGLSNTRLFCPGCTNGSWAHVVLTVSQPNAADSTSRTSGLMNLYVNGILVSTLPGWLPPTSYRPNLWLARPIWAVDSYFYGNIDSFFW